MRTLFLLVFLVGGCRSVQAQNCIGLGLFYQYLQAPGINAMIAAKNANNTGDTQQPNLQNGAGIQLH